MLDATVSQPSPQLLRIRHPHAAGLRFVCYAGMEDGGPVLVELA
jgi:hypothetical protein